MEEKVSLIKGIASRTVSSVVKSIILWSVIAFASLVIVATYVTPVFGLDGGTRFVELGTIPQPGERVLISPSGSKLTHRLFLIPRDGVDKREYIVVGRAGAIISPCGEFVCSKMGASDPVTVEIPSSLINGNVPVDDGRIAVYDSEKKEIVTANHQQIVGRVIAITGDKIPGLFGLISWVNDAHWLVDETYFGSAVGQSVENLTSFGDVFSQSGKEVAQSE